MLKNENHHSKHLQRAWNKYGSENFEFEIICYCDIEKLLKFEQKCLDKYQPWNIENGYNIARDALAPQKGIQRTIEEKIKISKTMKDKNFSQYRIGDKTSMFGKHHKEKSKIKSRFSQPTRRTIERINLVTGEVYEYSSISLARKRWI